MRARYGRWTGRFDPFPAEVSADDVLEEMGEDLLEGLAPDQALARLLRRGMGGRGEGRIPGLDELRRRVDQARRAELQRMGLEGPLRRVAEELDRIVERERTAVEYSAAPDAAERADRLDAMPQDVAGRVAALQDYDFTDRQAAADFAALLAQLGREVAEATFGRLAGAMAAVTPETLERVREMMADLNALIARRDRGEDVRADFDRFKQRHGDLVPGDPGTLDELLEDLARRMAAMSRLAASMDAEQRAQLAALAEQVLGQGDLAAEAAQLQQSLQSQFPGLDWDRGIAGAMPSGDFEGSLSETVEWVEHLQQMQDLGQALRQDYPGARLEDVDEDTLRSALGEDAVRALRALREIERVLEEAGAAHRERGRLELTPRGIRKLGERALTRIYARTVGTQLGSHRIAASGGDGELTGTTRPYAFGDPFRLDVSRTLANAVVRGGRREGGGLALDARDFELAEAERRVRTVTVLLLDMSFSMPLRGNWGPAKRVALALHALIANRFPEDELFVVGFSDYARRLQPRDLLVTGWERVYGTNMQHAFMLTRRLLAAHPGADRQVIMVTDGEPTAHLEGEEAVFSWPPEPQTLRLTLEEAGRLARTGATLNVFLLDHDAGAAVFVERMVRVLGGRIFYPDLDDLGSVVVRDFLHRRRA